MYNFADNIDWNKLSLEELADTAGEIDLTIKALAKKLEAAKKVIRQSKKTKIIGTTYAISVSEGSVRWSLDKDAIEKDMGEKWVLAHSKMSKVSGSISFESIIEVEMVA